MLHIDYDKCCWKNGKCTSTCCGNGTKCDGCVESCPTDALERKDRLVFYEDKCIECSACIEACNHGAITL